MKLAAVVVLASFALATGALAQAPAADTPLLRAVLANDRAAVGKLLRSGASATAANRYGVTPLAVAVINGDLGVVKVLLEAGADPNGTTGEGQTMLMSAARSGHVEVVRHLLASGADPNARESWMGQSALMWAVAENHAAVVTALMAGGADVNAASNLLEYWAMVPSEQATPKIPSPKGGMSVIHYAARQGSLEAVRALTSTPGVNLNAVDPDGINALLYATLNGHFDVAAFLLEKGADPRVADQYGRTVLFAAIDANRPEREPRPPARPSDTVTPLELAALALAKGADPNAVITGRIPNRCALGCQPPGAEGATPLWRAAKSSDVAAVRLLLAAGADVKLPAKDGSSPLMMAAGMNWREERMVATQEQSIETVSILEAAGADINAASASGETALHGAAGRDADRVIRHLAASGASLAAKDKGNRTALDVANGVSPPVRQGGGAAAQAPVREKALAVLRELTTTTP